MVLGDLIVEMELMSWICKNRFWIWINWIGDKLRLEEWREEIVELRLGYFSSIIDEGGMKC